MTAFQEIVHQPVGILLRTAGFLLLLYQVVLLARAVQQKQNAGWAVLSALHLLAGAVFMILLLDGAYVMDYLPFTRAYPPSVRALYRLPWLTVAGIVCADALTLTLFAFGQRRSARRRPSAQSIKDAVDLLPAGLCVSEPDGTVLLSNLKMNQWNQALTGGTLSDARALLSAVKAAGEPQGGKQLVTLKDGTALLFEESTLEIGSEQYSHLIAEDVTKQFRATKELKEKNDRLREFQYRLKTYRFKETELLTRQEILNARATVHNQLGGALLTGKYHLEHPENTDPEALRQMLLQINTYLLAEADDPEQRADAFDSARGWAEGIGVAVDLTGTVPAEGVFRDLLGHAIEECAANAVKHAGGDRLTVAVGKGRFEIANNGAAPSGNVVPVGGLRSLQLAVEQAGGTMTLQSRPSFRLTVSLPGLSPPDEA